MRIELDLEPDADPIAGRLVGPGGTVRDFQGWTALARALEAALAERAPRDIGKKGAQARVT